VLGNILIFLAIVGNAYYNVGIKKIAGEYTEIEMVFYTYVVVVLFLTPLVIYYEPDIFSRIPHFTKQTWTGLTLLTVFHNFLSMILFFKALKQLDAMQVALSNYMITFIGLPIAAIWLNEQLSAQSITGGVMVLIATLIITVMDYKINEKNKLGLIAR
jgi:drug/metabolite transporter (DMT)-like permease